MKIYTRRGDGGNTCLGNGSCFGKNNLHFQIIGAVDELNSWLGLIRSFFQGNQKLGEILFLRQKELFLLGTELAKVNKERKFSKREAKRLEKEIDAWQKELPKLQNFIFPGGDQLAALLHCARTVCRRLEQELVALSLEEKVNKNTLIYVNRLSDWLFTLARKINAEKGIKEEIWRT